ASHTRATPGVYDCARSAASRSGTVDSIAILPPRCSAKTGSSGSKTLTYDSKSVATMLASWGGWAGVTLVASRPDSPDFWGVARTHQYLIRIYRRRTPG